mgnify:CR=1 FL=1
MKRMKHVFYLLLVAVAFVGCGVNDMQGYIVMDKHGNYYELHGEDAFGIERYQLFKVDTSVVQPVGFNCN